ncbi:RNA polymerase sigma factor [Flagellimonas nanhaiensis]|uniref:Sigma-70 family RNA polymerase sigma factor n=1 Tax=Flagellimonas nanhaiensis TaxID=2292706 RepID=A0A371JL57_9FLAO|nr:sigma-70 family RNA polymerase sigma factor [Allomuricauda nanhaiensis]RDY57668.1 sigma-70 family RNA polymerase sigma factor [Allomuricauda nanhaiensis]
MEQAADQLDIAAIVNGDSKEFAKLVDMYKVMVFTIAQRMMKNREEAEEVSQDSFIKVYRSLKKFKGDSRLSTWIYRITYNTCLDRIKKYQKEQGNIPIEEVNGQAVAEMGNALKEMELKERSLMVKNCIEKLSSSDAAILTLFYLEERDLKELAKILGLTVNTAKVRLFRARTRLAVILRKEMEPETISSYEG